METMYSLVMRLTSTLITHQISINLRLKLTKNSKLDLSIIKLILKISDTQIHINHLILIHYSNRVSICLEWIKAH